MGALGMTLIAAGLIVVAGGIGFWLGRLGRSAGEAKLEETRAELDEYRRQVTEHFGETAGHFQVLGQQYKALYEHLAQGSEKLCDTEALDRELLFPLAGGAALEQTAGDSRAETPDSKPGDDLPEPGPTDDEALEATRFDGEADEPVDTEAADPGTGVSGDDDVSSEPLRSEGAAEEDVSATAAADAAGSDKLPADNVVELVPRGDSSSDDPDGDGDGKDTERTYH